MFQQTLYKYKQQWQHKCSSKLSMYKAESVWKKSCLNPAAYHEGWQAFVCLRVPLSVQGCLKEEKLDHQNTKTSPMYLAEVLDNCENEVIHQILWNNSISEWIQQLHPIPLWGLLRGGSTFVSKRVSFQRHVGWRSRMSISSDLSHCLADNHACEKHTILYFPGWQWAIPKNSSVFIPKGTHPDLERVSCLDNVLDGVEGRFLEGGVDFGHHGDEGVESSLAPEGSLESLTILSKVRCQRHYACIPTGLNVLFQHII